MTRRGLRCAPRIIRYSEAMLKAAVLAVALCLALISTLMADEGGPKSDQELIQGTWKAVSVQLNGRSADAVFVKEHPATFTFRGDAFRIVEATTNGALDPDRR